MRALLDHFGLRELPFGVTPDPRFLYFSDTHRETFATLRCGVELHRGFMALIAEPGMGKTTLLFHLLDSMRGAARTAFVFNTQRSAQELVRALIHDAGIETKHLDSIELFESFHKLLAQESQAGKQVLLVIDEAQNLEPEALEAVRLLSNFETSRAKLLQIILAGQPQLQNRLADESLAQLRQRISLICRLKPLSADEVTRYVEHRLKIAGSDQPVFSANALALIAKHSNGVPRNISNLCFHAMSIAFALNRDAVESAMVAEAVNDLSLAGESLVVPDQDPSASALSGLRRSAEKTAPNPPRREVSAPVEVHSNLATSVAGTESAHHAVRRFQPSQSSKRHIILGVLAVGLVVAALNSTPSTTVQAGSSIAGLGFQSAAAIKRPAPEYPIDAMRKGTTGVVVLRAHINEDGSITDVSPVSGPKPLIRSATNAVRRWRFRPAVQDGIAVPDEKEMRFEFRVKKTAGKKKNE